MNLPIDTSDARAPLPQSRRVRQALAALSLIAAAALVYYWLRDEHAAPAPGVAAIESSRAAGRLRFAAGAPQLSQLTLDAAVKSPLPATDSLPARVAYDENVTARISSPVAGRVVWIGAEFGARVQGGQELARIDAPEFAQAEAEFMRAKSDAARKQAALERAHALLGGGVIAQKDFELADDEERQAAAELRRTRARLANLGATDVGRAGAQLVLRTPFAGVVAERRASPALEVRPDMAEPLFVVSDLTRLSLWVEVPERWLAAVREGQSMEVRTDAYPDEVFTATVDRVAPAVNALTHRIAVRARLPNPGGRLKPEMYAWATFIADGVRVATRLPAASLVSEGEQQFAFVELTPGEFERRGVRVLRTERDYAYVDGIAPGERVVSAGTLLLQSEYAGGR